MKPTPTTPKTTRLSLAGIILICSSLSLPSPGLALELEKLSVPQGETLELVIPRFEYTEARGNYDGKDFPFYQITENIDPQKAISRAEFVQLIYLNQPTTSPCPLEQDPTAGFPRLDLPNIHNLDNLATDQSPIIYDSKGNLLYTTTATNTSCTTPAPPIDFPDISPQSPYAPAIHFAAENGLIHGYEDGLFHPYDPITRGQAAKIIMNAYHPTLTPEIEPPFFPDVPLDYSLRNELYSAVRVGIFRGYPDGLMRPNRSINFAEAHLITDRAGHFGDRLTSLTTRPAFRAYLGIHRLAPPGEKPLTITLNKATPTVTTTPSATPTATTTVRNSTITITKQNFSTVSFSLSTEKTKLFDKTYQDNTWALIDAAKATTNENQLWQGPFIIPASGEITLGFGDKLYINGVYSGSHFGIDYADTEGTPVLAANTGIVTLAGNTDSYGNTIVIDHGQNIFTMYLHLQELMVKTGDPVQKGAQIATMGQTGIATGPHLHFTNFIGDIIVDSDFWFQKAN